jgi:hypothetical protein
MRERIGTLVGTMARAIFDRKFGAEFLATVPREPGIYRMYDVAGGLLYVGKACNLRRRLAQYRTARRTKRDRKRRTLVIGSPDRVAGLLVGAGGIAHRDRAHPSVAPAEECRRRLSVYVSLHRVQVDGGDTRFCLTTSPEAFPPSNSHGIGSPANTPESAPSCPAGPGARLSGYVRAFGISTGTR